MISKVRALAILFFTLLQCSLGYAYTQLDIAPSFSVQKANGEDIELAGGMLSRLSFFPGQDRFGIALLPELVALKSPVVTLAGLLRFGKLTYLDLGVGYSAGLYGFSPTALIGFGMQIKGDWFFAFNVRHIFSTGPWQGRVHYLPFIGVRL